MSKLIGHHAEKRTDRLFDSARSIGRALDRGEFELWFQPKYELTSRLPIGAEGLARWRHPVRGILAPNEFLELLERRGNFDRFTRQMLDQAVSLIARAADEGHDIDVAVNLAPLSFLEPSLVPFIADLLVTYGVPGDKLVLELTERDVIDDRDGANRAFAHLRSLGVRISIDDFGTGFSSLSRLRQVPVDEIKIDRSFVASLDLRDPDGVGIVRMIVELARLMNHRIVAEGIETVDQLAILQALGTTIGQGFLFSPAVEADDLMALLVAEDAVGPTTPISTGLEPSRCAFAWTPDGLEVTSRTGDNVPPFGTHDGQLAIATTLLDLLPCAAVIRSVDGELVAMNDPARDQMDLGPPRGLSDSLAIDTRPDSTRPANGSEVPDRPQIGKIEHRHDRDGRAVDVRTSRIPVHDRRGCVLGFLTMWSPLEPPAI